MRLNINDIQKKLLLSILGQFHAVEWMKGKKNHEIEELIRIFAEALKEEGKEHIFHQVFQPWESE
jgi:hypothetical protein